MSATVTLPAGALLCHLPAPFRLIRGGELAAPALAYERFGPLDAPTVVVLGGISAGRRVAASVADPRPGFWDALVGSGKAIDTDRVQVLAFDWLGGAGDSTAPAAGEAFPFIDARDQAAALWQLCDRLGIQKLAAIVGSSYGGMVALHAAAAAPQRVARLCVLAAAHKCHPQASAWRAVQRGIVALGQRQGTVSESLALARALAMTTYRTPTELRERFPERPELGADGELDSPLADWLLARGNAFAETWNAEQFLCLSRSIDAHAIDPATVPVPTWLCAYVGDQLVPPADVRELALGLPALRVHRELRSRYGHDAFLKEPALVGGFLREVLA
jgi:homoserine O-acetyltransferase/O-succinyltransferase